MALDIIPELANELSACTREMWLCRGTWFCAISLNMCKIPKSILICTVWWDMESCQLDNWIGKLMFILTKSNPFSTHTFFPIRRQALHYEANFGGVLSPSSYLIWDFSWCPSFLHVPNTVIIDVKGKSVTAVSHPSSICWLCSTWRSAQLSDYLTLAISRNTANQGDN